MLGQPIVDQLACPKCLGTLSLEKVRLVCVACSRAYPIVDGIPVLIADRAESPGANRE
jgi:uncharacterized protein YbaR (Trm112 family)